MVFCPWFNMPILCSHHTSLPRLFVVLVHARGASSNFTCVISNHSHTVVSAQDCLHSTLRRLPGLFTQLRGILKAGNRHSTRLFWSSCQSCPTNTGSVAMTISFVCLGSVNGKAAAQ
ncbi:hypothetical protein IQ07DRAFT_384423 [Pyrenochaeta sp. DS3sAY3a]|nr:hypothetical protein IQ07DRAFT_384423 [Pyrenochaeta sp. DS3sAY3a]